MKVSFLITYYNQAQYVQKSIESCLYQKFDGDFEILVADDGSNDNTCDIVQSYIDKYPDKIKLFTMPREQGRIYNSIERVSAARLFLLENATGDYFCTLDGDDWYCSDTFLQKGIQILENDKTLAVCAFLYQMWYDENHIEKINWYKKAKRVFAREYIRKKYIHAGACIHRKDIKGEDFSIIKNIGIFDDNDILIYTLNKGDMYFIPEVIYSYRQTEGSSWNSSPVIVQKLINTWTYEIENKYSKYSLELLHRYSAEINSLFKNRNNINHQVSSKDKIYFDYAKNEETVFLKAILFYDEISISDKKEFYDRFREVLKYVCYDSNIFVKIMRKIRSLCIRIIGY